MFLSMKAKSRDDPLYFFEDHDFGMDKELSSAARAGIGGCSSQNAQ